MKYDEIIKLLDAGYSREEILAMKDEQKPEEQKPEEQKPEETKTEETKTEETSGMSDLVKELRDAISEMRKEFTAMNIMASRQSEEKTPEDIIANIINPSRTKKGE